MIMKQEPYVKLLSSSDFEKLSDDELINKYFSIYKIKKY